MGFLIVGSDKLIELENLSVVTRMLDKEDASNDGVALLQDIHLNIHKGEWLMLVGANGSGKSTLARLLAGRAGASTVINSGRLTYHYPEAQGHMEGRVEIPMVLQQPGAALVGATPWEDTILLLEQAGVESADIVAIAEQALSNAGLRHAMHQPLEELSGGQLQLVAIAGCLALRTPLLILDEATAMLDREAAAYVLTEVRKLHEQGTAVLWITQRLGELSAADRVVELSDGAIIYDGKPADWKRSNEQFETLHLSAWSKSKSLPDIPCLPLQEQKGWQLADVATAVHREGRAVAVLKHVEATLPVGTVTLLVGSNGSGKTTLLETIAGLREPLAGSIKLGDEALWIPRRYRQAKRMLNPAVLYSFGIALQHAESQWFASTVRAEFIYSMKAAKVQEAQYEARMADAMAWMGLHVALLSREPSTLSGGQMKRLAIACLIACQPNWLLLDEPLAGLDRDGVARVQKLLSAYKESGRSVLIITHDRAALEYLADQVLVAADGRLYSELTIESGKEDGREEEPEVAKEPKITTKAPVNWRYRKDLFDPRFVVLSYLLLASSMLAGHGLPLLFFKITLAVGLLIPLWQIVYTHRRLLRGYLVFMLVLIGLSGLTLQPLGFNWMSAEQNAIRLGELLLALLLGLPLMSWITPFRLQRGILQSFGWLDRKGLPVHEIALLVTLVFRFLPLLGAEWERYARLERARGKANGALHAVSLRSLHRLIVPYLRSLLRLAEHMADALEARGYSRSPAKRSMGFKVKPGIADFRLLLIAVMGSVIVLMVAWMDLL